MRKSFLIIAILLSFYPVCFPQAQVKIYCDDSWGPGRYNRVKVSIKFDDRYGFARFHQSYPVGFSIIGGEVTGGDFSAVATDINMVWMKIPSDKTAEFTYFVKPEPGMNGTFDMEGELVTVTDRTDRSVVLTGKTSIRIEGTNGLTPEEMNEKVSPGIVTNVTNSKSPVRDQSSGIILRIQVRSSSALIAEEKIRADAGIKTKVKVIIVRSGGIYKYQVGEFTDYEKAAEMLKDLKNNGISDAFIVAYRGSEQVPVSQVR